MSRLLTAASAPEAASEPRAQPLAALPWSQVSHLVTVSAALALWLLSLPRVELGAVGGLGLVSALPTTYFLAFGLLVLGFSVAAGQRPSPGPLLALYLVALVLLLHGTTPLLYDQPRYSWTYKHLGVIDLIATTGVVDREVDIYNNWPGFFAVCAWLSSLTGVTALSFAEWAQVFFNLVNLLVVRFALKGLTDDDGLVWAATGLFLLGNWVGQEYLAPQPLGFSLSVLVIGLALRCPPPPRPPRSRAGGWWLARLTRLQARTVKGWAQEAPQRPAPLRPRAALLLGTLCYLAVVVSHQLSPVMLIVGIAGLALLVRRVPLWIPAAMLAVEIAWLALAWPYLALHFELFSFDPLASPSLGGNQANGLPGLVLVERATLALSALLVLLAFVGLLRRLRAGHWDMAAAVLAAGPAAVLLAQAYGGEGRFRAYLFALPWVAFFVAAVCAPRPDYAPRGWLRSWRLTVAMSALTPLLLLAYYGLEFMNRMERVDVRASAWFERHAPSDSILLFVTPNFPNRLTARYAQLRTPTGSLSPDLTDDPDVRARRLGPADVAAVADTARASGASRAYVVLSPSQERYARLFGLLSPGSLRDFSRALAGSGRFRRVFQEGSAEVFEYRSARPAGRARRGADRTRPPARRLPQGGPSELWRAYPL